MCLARFAANYTTQVLEGVAKSFLYQLPSSQFYTIPSFQIGIAEALKNQGRHIGEGM